MNDVYSFLCLIYGTVKHFKEAMRWADTSQNVSRNF